jgi:hypothetical protein
MKIESLLESENHVRTAAAEFCSCFAPLHRHVSKYRLRPLLLSSIFSTAGDVLSIAGPRPMQKISVRSLDMSTVPAHNSMYIEVFAGWKT